MKRILPLVLALCWTLSSTAQPILKHPDAGAPLEARWAWAASEARSADARGGYWVGYSIERWMRARSYMGSFSTHDRRPTLSEVIYGVRAPDDMRYQDEDESLADAAQRALNRMTDTETDEELMQKEVAILFRFRRGGTLEQVHVSNISLSHNLKDLPVYWLGKSDPEPSFAWLKDQYQEARLEDLQEDLLRAIGLHRLPTVIVPFLAEVIASDARGEIREDAVFWMGQQDVPEAFAILEKVLDQDRSIDVREKAVFSISQMSMPEALDKLIEVARNGEHREVRKDAIFWLGQKASEKAVALLKDTVYDDSDTEIQEQAVFALSQLDEDEAIPTLIEIAENHSNPKVRKKAIFWLGQTEDPRALEALIGFVQGQE